MARNEEKAQSMLNRWLAYKKDEEGGKPRRMKPKGGASRPPPTSRRPALASSVDNVADCERWRMEILREIGRKVMEIQNGTNLKPFQSELTLYRISWRTENKRLK
jgi:pre-mRNA-splicing factor ISY1